MKTTRSALKKIVKECLVEILAEGLLTSSSQTHESTSIADKMTEIFERSRQQSTTQRQSPAPCGLPSRQQMTSDVELNHPVMHVAKLAAAGDMNMAAIFADTARTTLLEQDAGERGFSAPLDSAGRYAQSRSPEELFGTEAAKNWSTLAFAPGPKGPLGGNS